MTDAGAAPAGRFGRLTASLAEGFGLAVVRFPVAALLLAVISALVNGEVADLYPFGRENDTALYEALVAAVAASLSATLATEAMRRRTVVRLAAAVLAALAVGLIVWFGRNRFLFAEPLLAALVFGMPLVPYAGRPSASRFWTFTLWAGFGSALAFLSVILFVLGVSAILEMVRYLFAIGLSSRAYGHIYATAVSLVGPLFALGRVPTDFDEEPSLLLDAEDRLTAGLRVLLGWVAAPLVLVAAAILHLYAAKIAVSGEVPKNEVGWIVSVFAVFVLSLRIAADPLIERGAGAMRLFGRAWAATLVVPALLLAFALWQRVAGEGVTVDRYALGVAAVSIILIVGAQLVPRLRRDVRVMAAVPLGLLALSSVGPWGVTAAVGRSQTALVVRQLAVPNAGARVVPPGEAEQGMLRSRVEALASASALRWLVPALPSHAQAAIDPGAEGEVLKLAVVTSLGLDDVAPPVPFFSFAAGKAVPFDVAGFDLVLPPLYADAASGPSNRQAPPAAWIENGSLGIRFAAVADRIRLRPLLDGVRPTADRTDPSVTEPIVLDVKTAGGRAVRLRIEALSYAGSDAENPSLAFSAAVRRAEWTPSAPSFGGGGQGGLDAEPRDAVGERPAR